MPRFARPAARASDMRRLTHTLSMMKLDFTLRATLSATIVLAASVATARSAAAQGASAGKAVLDGRSLAGWQQAGEGKFVAQPDGSIVGEGGPGVLYYTGRTFGNFVLDLDYRADSPGAKSGIVVRVPEKPNSSDDALKTGYAVAIDDLGDPTHATGAIADVAAPTRVATKSQGQ